MSTATEPTIDEPHQSLASHAPEDRRAGLERLARLKRVPADPDRINLHCHSFFSYNSYGWSPSRVAWELRRAGAWAGGLVDFDVMDGLEEFHDAGSALGLRTNVSLETRTLHDAFPSAVLDSPGEPGVSYVCASGLSRMPEPCTDEGTFLTHLRQTATERNLALVERINTALLEIRIDYDNDVVPKTPGGTPTERHIIEAYCARIEERHPKRDDRATFLADLLQASTEQAEALCDDAPALAEKLRARLAKRGGVAYVQPGPGTFPALSEFFAWARRWGGIPMDSWLDGTSEGEADPEALLEGSRALGAVALNIIPDRNWNIRDREERSRKIANLHAILDVAQRLQWPVQIGTELNKAGQPLFDNLQAEALTPYTGLFRGSAALLVGHCISAQYAGVGFGNPDGKWVKDFDFSDNRAYFTNLGFLEPITRQQRARLAEMSRVKAHDVLQDSALAGRWMIT